MVTTYSTGLPALMNCDLVISRGANNTFKFNWSTSDGALPPVITPVNLTGYTAAAQIRNRVGGTIWITLGTGGEGITLDAAGNVTITITPDDMSDATWDSYGIGAWDIELTSSGGIVTRLVEGAVQVSQDVTR